MSRAAHFLTFPLLLAGLGLGVSPGTLCAQAPQGAPLAQASPPSAPAESAPPADARSWKLSGLMFGDYYVVAAHEPWPPVGQGGTSADDLEGRQGFWVRRIYLTYDQTFTPRLSSRLRLEANSAGDFASGTRLEPYVKDAFVRLALGSHAIEAGLVPTVSIQFADQLWGLRSVERTPLDLYDLDHTRDLGVMVRGAVPGSGRWQYEAQVGNGAGTASETDGAKSVRAALRMDAPRGPIVQGYVDHQARRDAGDWTTASVFAGWRADRWRAAGLYAHQRRRAPDARGQDPVGLDVLSGFGVFTAHERVALFARVDRVFDPLPDAASIDYLPLSGAAPFVLWIGGADILVEGPLRLQPNVEVVAYDRSTSGYRASPTVIPRVTLSVTW